MTWPDGLHPRISTELSEATSKALAVLSLDRGRMDEVAEKDLVFVTAAPMNILEQINILASFQKVFTSNQFNFYP